MKKKTVSRGPIIYFFPTMQQLPTLILRTLLFLVIPLALLAESSYRKVLSRLDEEGVFMAYIDLKDDSKELAAQMNTLYELLREALPELASNAPPLNLLAIEKPLGFRSIDAVGFSSTHAGENLFDNKTFLYTPQGPKGLLRLVGGEPKPFRILEMAPREADFVYELELHLDELVTILQAIAKAVMGEPGAMAVNGILAMPAGHPSLTLNDALTLLSTRIGACVVLPKQFDSTGDDLPFDLSQANFLVVFYDSAPAVDKLRFLSEVNPNVVIVDGESGTLIEIPWPSVGLSGIAPIVVMSDIKSGSLFLASNRAFLDRCRTGENPISENPDFALCTKGLPDKGSLLAYIGSSYGDAVMGMVNAGAVSTDDEALVITKIVEQLQSSFLLKQASVLVHQSDGIFFHSRAGYSQKVALASFSLMPMGLIASMAIPAFNKVRETSQEKAIINNLRQIASASQQYMLDTGNSQAAHGDVVGPGKHIESIDSVVGETYDHIVVGFQTTEIAVTTPDGRNVVYRF